MDVLRARVALRERPFIDVVDLALRFVAANARPYALLSVCVLAPAFGATWATARAFGWIAGWCAAVCLGTVLTLPFLVLASRLLFSEAARMSDVARASLRDVGRVVVVRLIQSAGSILSLGLIGLPWLYIGPALVFYDEVVVLERPGIARGLVRAQTVALGRFGAAFVTTVLVVAIQLGCPLVADVTGREVLDAVLQLPAPPPMWQTGGSWLALVGFWVAVPFVATTRFFVYVDCRTRTEGWDIQTRFAALADRARAEVQQGTLA